MLDINKLWKIVSQFIGPAALIIAIIFGITQYNRANRAERSIQTVTERVINSSVNIDTLLDDNGILHSKFESKVIPKSSLEYIIIDSVGSEIDSIIKPYKDKINELTIINSQLKSKNKGIREGNKVNYKDSTIKWVFDLNTDTLDLTVDLKTTYLKYDNGKQILGFNVGSKTLYTDIWWNDRRIKINSINSIRIANDLPSKTLNLSLGSEYRFKTNDLLLGPELGININNWNFNGKYYYNANNKDYEPVIGVKYHIFR